MLNVEETANVITLLEDLETNLRNSNLPESSKLIFSLANFLTQKQPLGWLLLSNFISDHLEVVEIRLALLHLLPKVKDIICPVQPEEEVNP